MGNVPRRMEPLVGAVLAHRADPNTVWHLNATYPQWCKQFRYMLSQRLRLHGTASHSTLRGYKEWDILGREIVNSVGMPGRSRRRVHNRTCERNLLVRIRDALCLVGRHDMVVCASSNISPTTTRQSFYNNPAPLIFNSWNHPM